MIKGGTIAMVSGLEALPQRVETCLLRNAVCRVLQTSFRLTVVRPFS